MLSNRESARRSRRRKQEHLSTLETEVSAKLFRFPHSSADVLCFADNGAMEDQEEEQETLVGKGGDSSRVDLQAVAAGL